MGLENGVEPVAQLIHTDSERWDGKCLVQALERDSKHQKKVKSPLKSSALVYRGNMGVIAMTGQNNPVGSPDDPDAALPYLHEQANVLNTLLKNRDVNL